MFYGDKDGQWQSGQVAGILGATSLVGSCLLPQLNKNGWQVIAFSRLRNESIENGITWQRLPSKDSQFSQRPDQVNAGTVSHWICLAPIWVLPDYFSLMEIAGVRRIVVLSSTSFYTKTQSSDAHERALAARLAKAETDVCKWAESRSIEWVILRPTLIYGLGSDKNITELIRFIRRFGFFPVFGQALGLRQPVHAQDVAVACLEALLKPACANKAYTISGGETLTYRSLVLRIFVFLGRPPRFVNIPLAAFKMAIALLRLVPRYQHWSVAMADRMNVDMVFDNSEAIHDLAFNPRGFVLSKEDFPE
jgi:nucleoside-diphosphate-sugar epimerase